MKTNRKNFIKTIELDYNNKRAVVGMKIRFDGSNVTYNLTDFRVGTPSRNILNQVLEDFRISNYTLKQAHLTRTPVTEFNYNDILEAFYSNDFGCCHISEGKYKKYKEIVLDNDEDGNGQWGSIVLTVGKDKILVKSGCGLTSEESQKQWLFSNYSSIDDMLEAIASELTNPYFSSFRIIRDI